MVARVQDSLSGSSIVREGNPACCRYMSRALPLPGTAGTKYVDLGEGDGAESGDGEEERGPDSLMVAASQQGLQDPVGGSGDGGQQGHVAALEVSERDSIIGQRRCKAGVRGVPGRAGSNL